MTYKDSDTILVLITLKGTNVYAIEDVIEIV